METKIIKKIWKQFDENKVIIGIHAYDKHENELFSYSNENGISNNETAMQLQKLITRKNSSFKLSFSNSYNAYFRR